MTSWTRHGLRFTVERKAWREVEHPRDRHGRFIEVGGLVKILGGFTGIVDANVGGGRLQVTRDDGRRVIVHRNYLTVLSRPGGGKPVTTRDAAPAAAPVEAPHPAAEPDDAPDPEPQEFWDAEEEPGVAYRVSSPANRDSITSNGLRPGEPNDTWDSGVYLFRSLRGVTVYRQEGDLYRVDTTGLNLRDDPWMPEYSIVSDDPIPPERLRLIGRRVSGGVVLTDPAAEPDHPEVAASARDVQLSVVYPRDAQGEGRVVAKDGDRVVGMLRWNYLAEPPVVVDMSVEEDYRRRGIATAMWEMARQNESRLQHSDVLTDEGREWARVTDSPQAIGGPDVVAPLNRLTTAAPESLGELDNVRVALASLTLYSALRGDGQAEVGQRLDTALRLWIIDHDDTALRQSIAAAVDDFNQETGVQVWEALLRLVSAVTPPGARRSGMRPLEVDDEWRTNPFVSAPLSERHTEHLMTPYPAPAETDDSPPPLDAAIVATVNDQLRAELAANPALDRILGNVLAPPNPALNNPKALAVTGGNTIVLNRAAMQPRQLASARENEPGGWFSTDQDTVDDQVRHILVHELGHVVAFSMEPDEKRDFVEGLLTRYGVMTVVNDEVATVDADGTAALVSRYGATSHEEFLAEAWAEYRLAETPRPVAREVGEFMVAHMGRVQPWTWDVPLRKPAVRLRKVGPERVTDRVGYGPVGTVWQAPTGVIAVGGPTVKPGDFWPYFGPRGWWTVFKPADDPSAPGEHITVDGQDYIETDYLKSLAEFRAVYGTPPPKPAPADKAWLTLQPGDRIRVGYEEFADDATVISAYTANDGRVRVQYRPDKNPIQVVTHLPGPGEKPRRLDPAAVEPPPVGKWSGGITAGSRGSMGGVYTYVIDGEIAAMIGARSRVGPQGGRGRGYNYRTTDGTLKGTASTLALARQHIEGHFNNPRGQSPQPLLRETIALLDMELVARWRVRDYDEGPPPRVIATAGPQPRMVARRSSTPFGGPPRDPDAAGPGFTVGGPTVDDERDVDDNHWADDPEFWSRESGDELVAAALPDPRTDPVMLADFARVAAFAGRLADGSHDVQPLYDALAEFDASPASWQAVHDGLGQVSSSGRELTAELDEFQAVAARHAATVAPNRRAAATHPLPGGGTVTLTTRQEEAFSALDYTQRRIYLRNREQGKAHAQALTAANPPMTYDEWYGELSRPQRAAYRKYNVSPSDHDSLVDLFDEDDHDAITQAVIRNSQPNGNFDLFELWREFPPTPDEGTRSAFAPPSRAAVEASGPPQPPTASIETLRRVGAPVDEVDSEVLIRADDSNRLRVTPTGSLNGGTVGNVDRLDDARTEALLDAQDAEAAALIADDYDAAAVAVAEQNRLTLSGGGYDVVGSPFGDLEIVQPDEYGGQWVARRKPDDPNDRGAGRFATGATPERVLRTLRERFGPDVTMQPKAQPVDLSPGATLTVPGRGNGIILSVTDDTVTVRLTDGTILALPIADARTYTRSPS